jgi:hypothetical protein
MEIDKEGNKKVIERITFHLVQALRLCSQLNLSGLSPLQQKDWNERIKICKDALEFTKGAVEKLSILLG